MIFNMVLLESIFLESDFFVVWPSRSHRGSTQLGSFLSLLDLFILGILFLVSRFSDDGYCNHPQLVYSVSKPPFPPYSTPVCIEVSIARVLLLSLFRNGGY